MLSRRTLFVLVSSLLVANGLVVEQENDQDSRENAQLRTMEKAIRRELAWAEHAMETYMRQNDKDPLRSSIRGDHVHSSEWTKESVNLLQKQY
jgi:hypothetical protein